MLVSCEALIQIQEDILVTRKILKFLLLGRFTQDFVKNLFSLVRFRLSVPNALQFKFNLRIITLAQLCVLSNNNSSFFNDTEEDILLSHDFLAATKRVTDSRKEEEAVQQLLEGAALHVREVDDEDLSTIDSWEWSVLYTMAGSVMRSLEKMNIRTCNKCFKSLL